MSSPTPNQQRAIDETGTNIIVSAGAGSGKTFVLKERVLKTVKSGVPVDNLIILTFTNAAALEMKNRIRKILAQNNLKDAEIVDSAYITTFDSFANSIVKKYNYLLGMPKNFTIIDSSIVTTEIKNILDEILEEEYKNKEERFVNFINNLCYKKDDSLRESIIKCYRSLQNIINRREFLNTYIDTYFAPEFVEQKIDEYENNIFEILSEYREIFELINEHSIDDNASLENEKTIELIDNISSIDELVDSFNLLKIAKNKRAYDEEFEDLKKQYSDIQKKLESYLTYTRKDLEKNYMSTKNDVEIIINILLKLDEKLMKFKDEKSAYEFIDIEYKAIEIVKNYKEVREEIKNNTYEIMIDEYQDTNDIQEEFVNLIENNNVYMVGDVKQSIYGFRNANPYIFKSKYDKYAKKENGIKIDLETNFRSRREVIKNINDIFSYIMYDNIGGANYKKDHIMEFGKKFYDENTDIGVDYNLTLLNYKKEKEFKYSKDEIEAFIIADDIKKKIGEKRHTYHEVDGSDAFIDISYKDFCILVDKSTNFELIRKILESKGIPVYIDKSLSIKEDDEIFILKNLITLLVCIKNKDYDYKFKHAYASVSRSYIYKLDDNEIYNIFKNNNFVNTELYKILEEIVKYIDVVSNKELLYMLIDKFDFINKTILVGDVNSRIIKLESFINQADSLNKFGMDIYSLENHFENILNSDDSDIQINSVKSDVDAVRVMTIHGSKGLEFNYVYMPYMHSKFKFKETSLVSLNKAYGIITPFYDDGLDNTFMYHLNNLNNTKETISEKIRLFYVAITRAKEQFIMVSEFNEKLINDSNIDEHDLLSVKSFEDIITLLKNYLIPYTKYIDINNLDIDKNYLTSKNLDYKTLIDKTNEVVENITLNIEYEKLENKHFSKSLSSLMNNDFKKLLDFGTMMHYYFEIYDFKKNNIDELDIEDKYKKCIKAFLKHDEVKNISNAKIYKEHEIKYNYDGNIMHGFIDLLVEYEDHFDIFDYKLSNIDSIEYERQLNGYKDYIENKYKKSTNIYLYSIYQDLIKKINN